MISPVYYFGLIFVVGSIISITNNNTKPWALRHLGRLDPNYLSVNSDGCFHQTSCTVLLCHHHSTGQTAWKHEAGSALLVLKQESSVRLLPPTLSHCGCSEHGSIEATLEENNAWIYMFYHYSRNWFRISRLMNTYDIQYVNENILFTCFWLLWCIMQILEICVNGETVG